MGPGGETPALHGRRDARRHGSVGLRRFLSDIVGLQGSEDEREDEDDY
jgi:hypothetical protein